MRNRGKRFYHSPECRLAAMPGLLERLLAHTDRNGPVPAKRPDLGPCWIWMGARSHDLYGNILVGDKLRLTHIVSYELHRGPVPPSLVLHHMCETPLCCNPWHLEALTRQEHSRQHTPGLYNKIKTHCPHGHPYTEENTYRYEGSRQCRTCVLARSAKRNRQTNAVTLNLTPFPLP